MQMEPNCAITEPLIKWDKIKDILTSLCSGVPKWQRNNGADCRWCVVTHLSLSWSGLEGRHKPTHLAEDSLAHTEDATHSPMLPHELH